MPKRKKSTLSNRERLKRYTEQRQRAERRKAAAREFLNTVQDRIIALQEQIFTLEKTWPEMEDQYDESTRRLANLDDKISKVNTKARAEKQLVDIRKEVRRIEREQRREK